MDLHDPQKKMSKSGIFPTGLIRLTDSPEVIRSKIAAATTDSGREIRLSAKKPGISNLITIYSIVSGTSPEDTESALSGKTYAQLKSTLSDKLVEYMRPVRERYEQLRQEYAYVEGLLLSGSAKAAAVAEPTRAAVFECVGIGMRGVGDARSAL